VGQILDEVAPDAVLTFGTDGVTGHADHRAVARWVNASVAARGGRIPIIATAANAAWSPSLIDRLHTVSMFYPGYPERERNRDVLHAGLGDELLDVKLAALRAHASQVGPVRAALGEDGYQQMASVEAYRPTNRAAAMTLGLAASFPCAA
jgi:LmbE family N-acetylglucosaminyl deacetylase